MGTGRARSSWEEVWVGLVTPAPQDLAPGGTLTRTSFLPDNQAIATIQQKSQRFKLANLILLHLFSVSYYVPKRTQQNANYNWVNTVPS